MKTKYLILFVIITSCAKLPVETLTLSNAITTEGKRMHELNISLLNKIFNDKRERIDTFIDSEYTPKYLENFKKRIPDSVDVNKELPNILESIMPVINKRRSTMHNTLEEQRLKLITKLNTDYTIYKEASSQLHDLIESATKVNQERIQAFQQITNLSKNKVDFNKIETELEKYILNAGKIGGDIDKNKNQLNQVINSLIK